MKIRYPHRPFTQYSPLEGIVIDTPIFINSQNKIKELLFFKKKKPTPSFDLRHTYIWILFSIFIDVS